MSEFEVIDYQGHETAHKGTYFEVHESGALLLFDTHAGETSPYASYAPGTWTSIIRTA